MDNIAVTKEYLNWNGDHVSFEPQGSRLCLIFLSLYCLRCVDLLPHIGDIVTKQSMDTRFVILVDGDYETNKEMVEYFNWKMPVVQVESQEMGTEFAVYETPTVQIYSADGNRISSGIADEAKDVHFYLERARLEGGVL
ncbi:hypothetical protein [Paenibacillus xylanexedens]|uniref:Thioredoxin-related protein n=1 Tax=Paenibacillus xylanexedens TaxID=528191 RepID=A0ABS4RYN6_PAEXY|nr:hypothetical protein [Paenibacillus xylanexedens]MBP2247470.1 thioredoxin-related protein [Paenibacillus xylanexedens]